MSANSATMSWSGTRTSTNPAPWGWILVIFLIAVAGIAIIATQSTQIVAAASQTFQKTSDVGTITVLTTPAEGGCKFDANFASNLVEAFSVQGFFKGPCDGALKEGLLSLEGHYVNKLEETKGWEDQWRVVDKVIDFIFDTWASL